LARHKIEIAGGDLPLPVKMLAGRRRGAGGVIFLFVVRGIGESGVLGLHDAINPVNAGFALNTFSVALFLLFDVSDKD
jgi:hypothetical protein